MNLASRFISPEKQQIVSKAFDMATQIYAVAKNPRDALERAGITKEDIKKAESLLNNPLAGSVLDYVGANKQDMLSTFTQAKNFIDTPVEQAPAGGELEALQKTLAMLNK